MAIETTEAYIALTVRVRVDNSNDKWDARLQAERVAMALATLLRDDITVVSSLIEKTEAEAVQRLAGMVAHIDHVMDCDR